MPAVLAAVRRPRARRGIHTVIVSMARCAVLAGARSWPAIAAWAGGADQATGMSPGPPA